AQIPGRRELEEMTMQDGESEPPVMETLPNGGVSLTFKDPNDLKNYFISQNGQPQPQAATPNPTGDAGWAKNLRDTVQVGLGIKDDITKSIMESAMALKELRPAPAVTPAPIVTDDEAIRAQTENDLLKHALSQGADNPLAMRVIEGILGKAPTNGSEEG